MKKLIYSSLILGSALALASCSADEPGIAKGDGNQITLTVQLPDEISTRFSDGKSITNLYYSVFKSSDNSCMFTGSMEWNGQTAADVTLDLVPSQTYNVVFFACNNEVTSVPKDGETPGTAYTYNPASGEFKINYENVAINDDRFDAFYVTLPGVTTEYDTTDPVSLVRPFAQLNIGSTNVTSEFIQSATTTLTVGPQSLASGMSFLPGGKYTASEGFTKTATISEVSGLKDAFPVTGYSYLNMMYLLVDPGTAGQALINAEFTIKQGETVLNTINLESCPAKPNYQTNVYGSLLTERLNFKVNLTAGYGGSIMVWDGKSVENVDLSQSTIEINNPAQFVGCMRQISNNGGEPDYGGKTISINCDIDLGNHLLTGIGNSQMRNLVINGNGTTVSNLNINRNDQQWVALLPRTTGCTIKNWNFINAKVVNSSSSYKYAAVLTSLGEQDTFENLTFTDCRVEGIQKCAIVNGYSVEGKNTNPANPDKPRSYDKVTVTGSTVIVKNGQGAAICSYASNNYTTSFKDCTVKDCTITADDLTEKSNNFQEYGIGTMLGIVNSGEAVFVGCNVGNCTLKVTKYNPPETSPYTEAYINQHQSELWGAAGKDAKITVNGTQVFPPAQ